MLPHLPQLFEPGPSGNHLPIGLCICLAVCWTFCPGDTGRDRIKSFIKSQTTPPYFPSSLCPQEKRSYWKEAAVHFCGMSLLQGSVWLHILCFWSISAQCAVQYTQKYIQTQAPSASCWHGSLLLFKLCRDWVYLLLSSCILHLRITAISVANSLKCERQ